jgi:hypothetical protein
MAYMVPIATECDHEHCHLRATHEVRNNRNEKFGKFCQAHAAGLVGHLEEVEARELKEWEKANNAVRFYEGG